MSPDTHASVVVADEAMRTRFEIVVAGPRDEAFLRAAGEEALDEIRNVEADLSVFRRDSVFFQLNAEADEGPVRVDAVMFGLLERARTLSERLDGAFDLTVGALVQHWKGAAPHDFDEARACVGFARLVALDGRASTVAFARPGVRLDPGALGKGWALERAGALLQGNHVTTALLHGGTSSVLGLGAPSGQDGWTVAIQSPDPTAASHISRVRLCNRGLSVSSAAGRTFERNGRVVGHVIDPRSGQPVSHTALAAVVADSPTDAEAISTALLVLGVEGLSLVEDRFPGVDALVASADPAGGFRVDVLGDAFAGPD